MAAGSSHASRHYENSYNLVEFEVGSAECMIRRFVYMTESGEFRELQDTQYVIALGGSSVAASAEIAEVLRQIDPSVHPYADYFAALLTGEMNDVPVELADGKWGFASREFPLEFQFREVRQFLRVSNMLRTYYDIPLEESVALHKSAILELTALIGRLKLRAPSSPRCSVAMLHKRRN